MKKQILNIGKSLNRLEQLNIKGVLVGIVIIVFVLRNVVLDVEKKASGN